ncbi:hypothetical protein ACSYAY_01775 [Leptospirillum ferriphilum]|uniref:hypothetical protein n=1 Tax=Leptospirillum ferriphilum TaxID=178606 RepID=UPI003EE63A3F
MSSYKKYLAILFFMSFLFHNPCVFADQTPSWRDSVVAPIRPQTMIKVGLYFSKKAQLDRLNRAIQEEKLYGGRNKLIIIKNLENVKKGVISGKMLNIKLVPPETFHGKLKKVSPVKLLFSISGTDSVLFAETLGNIIRAMEYLHQHHIRHHVELLVYGPMVNIFDNRLSKASEGFLKIWKAPLKKYVDNKELSVFLCRNAMTINGMVRHDIPNWVRITPMASLETFRRIKEGYVYMTNP